MGKGRVTAVAVEPSRERARRKRTRRQRDQVIALLVVLAVGFLLHKTGYGRFLSPASWVRPPGGVDGPNGSDPNNPCFPEVLTVLVTAGIPVVKARMA